MLTRNWALILSVGLGEVMGHAIMAEFNCADLPNACTNMCWGAYCTPDRFGTSMNFDDPSSDTKTARRTKAGCKPGGNRCNDKKSDDYKAGNNECDEYPFASVLDAEDGQQTSRCVPPKEQRSQGGTLTQTFRQLRNAKVNEFLVVFGNPGAPGVKYCNSDPCKNDDKKQFCGDKPCADPPAKAKLAKRHYYKTGTGTEILVGRELEVGNIVTRVVHFNEARATERRLRRAKRAAADQGEFDLEDFDSFDDVIVEKL
ncbi:MAG: hypothetical protein M1816_005490 [Peltula sp. TS41687]|nr:MAG: hypothetical protein M1816_005490 [Peltula sp. TS41687]